jgi:general secretion pathway protein K
MKNSFTWKLFKGQKSQSGVAMLMAIFTMVIITYLVVEISYESNVEYIVNGNAVNRVQSYYAAKAGLDFALLRLKIYQKAQGQFQNLPPAQRKLLDLIWQFPLNWPLALPGVELPTTDSAGTAEDGGLESDTPLMDATWATQIVDEGSKIDINDLDSPSKGLREASKALIMGIFENKMENDENFRRKYQDFRFEELVNNIIDWLDADLVAINGGDERQFYEVSIENVRLPPNRGFRTVDEVRLVTGMTEELFALLKDRVTVYGMKAINPNYATAEVIKSIHSSITDEVAAAVIARRDDEREGGPYVDANDFWGYVQNKRGNVPKEIQDNLPLVFEAVYNFKITATGEKNGMIREITAITFDLDSAAMVVAEKLQSEANSNAGAGGNGGSGTSGGGTRTSGTGKPKNTKQTLPKGPPRIVYFLER